MALTAIIPAAGFGKRFGANKPLALLRGEPLLAWALKAMEAAPGVTEIIPVVKPTDAATVLALARTHGIAKCTRIAHGGAERQDSVWNALRLIEGDGGVVLVHDGARPLVSQAVIARCIEGMDGLDGAIAAVPPKDTIKQSDDGATVARTLDRATLWSVQTPQVFRLETLRAAYEAAYREGVYATDDAALVERAGGRVRLVMGEYENLKVTTPEDIAVAEAFMRRREANQ